MSWILYVDIKKSTCRIDLQVLYLEYNLSISLCFCYFLSIKFLHNT